MSDTQAMWWRSIPKDTEPLNERQFMDFVNAVRRRSAEPLRPHTHLLPGRATREPGDYVCVDCGTLVHIERPL